MNTNLVRAALALTILALAGPSLAQGQPQVIDIPLSRPGEPVTLEIDILSADIEVVGEDRDDASFEIAVEGGQRQIITPSGAKQISGGSYSFEIDEDDNEISVDTDWRADKVRVMARIPRRADVQLETVNDGKLAISNIEGNVELYNTNGPITARNIAGSVIAESINETIDIGFARIDDDSVSSLESLNGDLYLRIPRDTGIELHLDSGQGEISSSFEVEVMPSDGIVTREDDDASVSVRIENVIVARINGGGPVVRMKTLHGDIRILEAE